MSGPLPTFSSWRDRIAYVVAEAQLLVAGVLVSAGAALLYFQPQLPGIPAWVRGAFAAVLLLGPFLFAFFMSLISRLRTRNWVTVHHINAEEDVREKYNVAPEIWQAKDVDGPPPYPVNGGGAWEVREFEFLDDVEQLRVTGTWLSATADSKLITSKSLMEDIHGVLTDGYLELARLRGRVSRMGVEIQEATVHEMMEAAERGTMMDSDAVREAYEDAKGDATEHDLDELPDLEDHPEDPRDLVGDGDAIQPPTAADGGENDR